MTLLGCLGSNCVGGSGGTVTSFTAVIYIMGQGWSDVATAFRAMATLLEQFPSILEEVASVF